MCVRQKKKEFKLCVDSATDVARLGVLCFCIQRFVAVFAVPPRCTAIYVNCTASALDWTSPLYAYWKYNVRNKRATASTNHIYSFLFILLLLQLPRPFPHHYQFRPPCHSHDGTASLFVVCVCVTARPKSLCTIDVSRFSQPQSYQQIFRSARHFIIFGGKTEVPTAGDGTVYALLLKAGCWSCSVLFALSWRWVGYI